MKIKHFYDRSTNTLSYVIHKNESDQAVVIDPVLNFEPLTGRVSYKSILELASYLHKHSLEPALCLETHVHADHLSGCQGLRKLFPKMKVGISQRIDAVLKHFAPQFHEQGSSGHFDILFQDNEIMEVGPIKVKTLPTPGHTPACTSFLIEDAVFTGDTLFMPDSGTGRCDFPAGSAKQIYASIQTMLYSLPDTTRVFTGHDYQPGGRELRYESTIAEQKSGNMMIPENISEEAFIKNREDRDKTLSAPRLLLPSIQVNIRAGHLPEAESNGTSYLKIPLTIDKAQ